MPNCTLCNNLERKGHEYRVAFDFQLNQLERSINDGCKSCAVLHGGIKHFLPNVGGLSSVRHVYVWGKTVDGEGGLEVDLYLDDGKSELKLEYFINQGSCTPSTALKASPRISGNTNSAESFAWASKVLENCVASHKNCNTNHVTKLPSRVLDIEFAGDQLNVKLLESNGAEGRYACLSHCWGRARSFMTEKRNVAPHRNHIAWESFPRTFQDAILFTRKLGLRYLWIDSLCIIQDEISDWVKESSKMASIYQNSFITIAATKSADDEGGCFSTGPPLHSDHALSAGLLGHQVFVREKLSHWNTIEDYNLFAEYPLLTRGWVYQERLLSPRVLHFCQKELVWECLEESFCECTSFKPLTQPKVEHFAAIQEIRGTLKSKEQDGTKLSSQELQTRSESSTRRLFKGRFSKKGKQPEDLPRNFKSETLEEIRAREREAAIRLEKVASSVRLLKAKWHDIVRDYSNLTLTVESDRLIAIAGLAREAQECRTGSYLAGLWQDSLVEDLLWRVDRLALGQPERRPATYRAPTWSWASVNSGVSYFQHRNNEWAAVRISEAVCKPKHNSDPYGQVSHGHLVIEGIPAKAEVIYTFYDNGELDPIHYKLVIGNGTAPFYADYCLCLEGPGQIPDGSEVYCLRMFNEAHSTIYLVLRQLKPDTSEYERIGIVDWPSTETKGSAFQIDVSEFTTSTKQTWKPQRDITVI